MRPARNFRKRIQILIIDREAVFRFGLRRLLAAGDNLRDIAEAENLTQAIHMARQLKPDLIFLQAELLTEKIAEQMNKLRKASPGCKLVITAASLTEGESLRYIRLGASGVVLKSLDPALFIKCVGKVMQGSSPLHLPRPVDTLTQREKAIISYLVQGWRNREIAEQLSISEQTVKNHLRAVYDKVGVADRLELVLYAIYQRLDLPAVQVSSKSNS